MSTIYWENTSNENKAVIVQKLSSQSNAEELGREFYDKNINKYVVMLKDNFDNKNQDCYLRGPVYENRNEMLDKALTDSCIMMMHMAWMRRNVKFNEDRLVA